MNARAMTNRCAHCGAVVNRVKSQLNVRGFVRNFCTRKCVGEYRKTQTGKLAHRFSHGGKGTRLYGIWKNIKTRCFNKRTTSFHRYGGRGITMCREWVRSFVAFRDWAMSHGYSSELEIDRKNNNGNYTPSNCRWTTNAVNRRNSSTFRRSLQVERRVSEMVGRGFSYPKIASLLAISKSTVFRIAKDQKWDVTEVKP